MLQATSVINSPWSVTAEYIVLATPSIDSTRWSQILAQNHDFCLPYLHVMPFEGPCLNITIRFGMQKLEWWCYPMVKILKIHLFVVTEFTNGWTDRQTDGHRMMA